MVSLLDAMAPILSSICRRTLHRGIPVDYYEDAVSVAQVAVARAVETYDPEAGASFSSYSAHAAIWAVRAMKGIGDVVSTPRGHWRKKLGESSLAAEALSLALTPVEMEDWEEMEETGPGPVENALSDDERAVLAEAISDLPPRQRSRVEIFLRTGKICSEPGGKTRQAADWIFHSALQMLRKKPKIKELR